MTTQVPDVRRERVGDVVLVSDGPVLRATIDRPDTRNAISPTVVEGLDAAVRRARQTGARVLVIRGAGGVHRAGAAPYCQPAW